MIIDNLKTFRNINKLHFINFHRMTSAYGNELFNLQISQVIDSNFDNLYRINSKRHKDLSKDRYYWD